MAPRLALSTPSQSNTFVGRRQEMGDLKAALQDAMSGRGRLIMLAGEPGIGKTRTAQEIANQAQAQGAVPFWGRCYEEEGTPAYWPWIQIIRSLSGQLEDGPLKEAMGPRAADISKIVPELMQRLPGLEPPPQLEPEQARFRLFDSITAFFKRAAKQQPLVLVLEDLHWADQASLLLLHHLARDLDDANLLTMGTYRDVEVTRQHPLTETLGQLSRERGFQKIVLKGLGEEDAEGFCRAASGVTPSPSLVAAIHAHTEGNPFFMTEIVRLLGDRGELAGDGQIAANFIRIPDGVRDAIGQRLNRLSEACVETLTVAAIIGREFHFELLRALGSEDTDAQLLKVIDEALGTRLIEESPAQIERYQFSHALIQQTLAEELSASRRVRLHAQIGAALEGLYGDGAEAHAAELAYHFGEAVAVSGTERLVHYSILAGERALTAYAWEEGLMHFQRALEAKQVPLEGTESATDSEAAALLFGLGRARAATHQRNQMQEAIQILSRAFEYYVDVGEVARAVIVAGYPDYSTMLEGTELTGLIGKALELVRPDSPEAGRLLSLHGGILGLHRNDYGKAQEAFDRALFIARREGDIALEMRTLVDSASVDIYHLRWRETITKGLMAIEMAQTANDPRAEVAARYFITMALSSVGELEEMRRHAEAMLAPAERLRDNFWLTSALWRNEIAYRLAGDWETARKYSDRCLAISPTRQALLADRVMLECEVGEFGQSETHLERFSNVTVGSARLVHSGYVAMLIPLAGKISGSHDNLDTAEEAARSVLFSASANPNAVSRAQVGLGLVAVLRNHAVTARHQYSALEAYKGTYSWWLISVDRLLGLLAKTVGNREQAFVHFEDSLAFCRKAGYRPELAWTCYDFADTLLERDDLDDQTKARSLLDEALVITRELSMKPLQERVGTLQERIESLPDQAPAFPDGLSQREVEVLGLVATGRSNRQIAAELVLSVRTIERHVTNIYTKIDARGRAEAATYALSHGLTTST